MRRRQFITLLSGAAAAWPLAARAQQTGGMRRIGVLLPAAADDPLFQTWVGAFLQALGLTGWTIGRNVRIDTRWAGPNAADISKQAVEMVALAPDVILAHNAAVVAQLLQMSRTVPIVFALAGDPVGAGLIDSLARPGGNVTGFMSFEFSEAGKRLELLKQIAPNVTRAAVLRDATQGSGTAQFAAIQALAPSLKMEVTPIDMRDAGAIERGIAAFARSSNGGLIPTAANKTTIYRNLIITLAAQHKLPAVYSERLFVADGGLISYGFSIIEQYRKAAGYVDRILRGEKPADLPVQAPTTYELVINAKTAKALGITVPASLLASATCVGLARWPEPRVVNRPPSSDTPPPETSNQFDLPTGGHDLTLRHIESNGKQMPFQPGQSGNPGGRRRKSDDDRRVEELARSLGEDAINTLASIMKDAKAPASARSAAAQGILDRGHGRPLQSIRHGGEEDASPIRFENLSEYQLEMLIKRLER